MATGGTILWRRLDVPGHDACRLSAVAGGWRLEGAAVFRHERGVARLDYLLVCDTGWRARRATVSGWIGRARVAHVVERAPAGGWTLDGAPIPAAGADPDLDLGFTPATNLPVLRRLALAIGQAADAPAAWLDVGAGTLERLAQRYERRSALAYAYEAPRFGYAAVLDVAPAGFVLRYPGLWEAEDG
jgi:hypothetical protein